MAAGTRRIPVAIWVGVVAFVAFMLVIIVLRDLIHPRVIGPIKLAELEKRVDDDPTAVAKEMIDHPVIIDAVVSSVEADRLTLESIGVLKVQAYFNGTPPSVAEKQAVRLRCRDVKPERFVLNQKPVLRDCSLI